jgi:hypothetical protein
MRRTIAMASMAALALALIGLAQAETKDLPAGWVRAGSQPNDYEMALDTITRHAGTASAFIKAKTATPGGFGTLMQTFSADQYRGKRLRLAGYVKAAGIARWAGLWMRVDGPNPQRFLSFDNMQNRPIKGTLDWKRYEIVLDVPQESTNIAFGILLEGPGQAWIDDLGFDVVGISVPVTSNVQAPPSKPANLSFEN